MTASHHKIHLLPTLLQNQIAAGEVVERPLSVIKELVENSIDAGATRILVTIKKGGKEFIMIEDNGSGMSHEDALLACTKHATSKISSVEDLHNISSLGFRGEALASISSVSNFTLKTRTKDTSEGTSLIYINGAFSHQEYCGMPVGTMCIIEDLFTNVPARKAFLKSDETEYQHIADYLYNLSLSHPQLSILFVSNGKTIFDLRAETIEQRLHTVFGKEFMTQSIPVFHDNGHVHITGYISAPFLTYAHRQHQVLIINDRIVTEPTIQKAIKDAYHRRIIPDRHPAFFLHITFPTFEVDVNVHPRKKEVRLKDPQAAYAIIKKSLDHAFNSSEQVRVLHTPAEQENIGEKESKTAQTFFPSSTHTKIAQGYTSLASRVASSQRTYKQEPIPYHPLPLFTSTEHLNTTSVAIDPEDATTSTTSPLSVKQGLCYQLHNSYILVDTIDGLKIIDQHAAHERILFDQLMAAFEARTISGQKLLFPEIIHLSQKELNTLLPLLPQLDEIGCSVEQCGPQEIAVHSIPNMVSQQSLHIETWIKDMITSKEFEGLSKIDTLHLFAEKVYAYMACRSAVKFGDPLTENEMLKLLENVALTPGRHTCPHGRNVQVLFTMDHLKSLFDRT